MDEKIKIKMEEKIRETISNKNEIKQIHRYLSDIDDSKSFLLGIIAGRLYNAFYYQTKRILDREPTKAEFDEFVEYLKNRKSDFETLW